MESSEKKNLIATNSRQFQTLVSLMKKNVRLAKGISTNDIIYRTAVDDAWKEIAKEINLYGPPSRTGSVWKKIWFGLKSRTKKKIVENNKILNSGHANSSRMHYLSELEQSIDSIVQFSNALLTEDLDNDSSALDEDINEALTFCEVQMDISNPSTSQPKTKKTKKSSKPKKLIATKNTKSIQNIVYSRRNCDKYNLKFRLMHQQIKSQDTIFKVMMNQAAATKNLAEAANRQSQALTTIASSSQAIALALEDVLKNLKND